jgi:glycosyltransferase involved in cell wall biosynthesis
MNDACLVSVVIPFFNDAVFLPGAVRSVLEQEQPGTEILLVDDCSTDNSAVVARSLADRFPGVRLLRSPANGGPAATRNLGLRHASGQYLCFLDADDEYAPGFFRRAIPQLEKHVDRAGVVTGIELVECHRDVHPVQLDAVIGSLPSNLLLCRVAVDLLGGFPEGPAFRGAAAGEDIQFRLALQHWFQLLWCPERFLRYRVRRDSHFEYFLERSQVVGDKLVFSAQTAEEKNGAAAAAARLYHEQVARRLSILATLRNREQATTR